MNEDSSGRSQFSTPLFDAVVKYAKSKKVSFHTPGHKHGTSIPKMFKDFAGSAIFTMDLTLLEEVDCLSDPTGVIKEAQELAAQAYGADHTFFLVNGTSGGNHAMILSSCEPGDKIIVPRNAHKSVLTGVILSGAFPVYIQPKIDEELNVFTNVTPEQVENALNKNPDTKVVLITNPTYKGIACDIKRIAEIVHSRNKILLVDEAHGPHLHFSENLPLSAMSAGADMCVQSSHKIISAMTQSSMLHLKKDRLDVLKVKKAIQMLQTTSPSYILLSSLDVARMQMATYGNLLLEHAIELSKYARMRLNKINKINSFGREVIGREGIFDIDLTKVTINVKNTGLSGYEVAKILNYEFNLQPELADPHNVLLLVSIGNSKREIDRIITAFKSKFADEETSASEFVDIKYPKFNIETIMTPREAIECSVETVKFSDSYGMVCAEVFTPYPPGIPLLVPGEKITREVCEYIKDIHSKGARIQGQYDAKLETIKVISRNNAGRQ